MGRRDRERVARILAGEEEPRAKQVVEKMRETGVAFLQRSSTSNQVKFLADSLHSGRLSASKLGKELANNAEKEMSKGIKKLVKKGKEPTVDLLLAEYRGNLEFKRLASEVGLDEDWFMNLAEKEIVKWREQNGIEDS